MFGMSFGELIIILVVALIVFGPERLPEIASRLGKFSAELKKTSDSFRREFYNSVYTPADELRSIQRDVSRLVAADPKPPVEEKKPTVNDNESSPAATDVSKQ